MDLDLEFQASGLNSRNKKALFENSFSVKSDVSSTTSPGRGTMLRDNNSIAFLNESLNEDTFNLSIKSNKDSLSNSVINCNENENQGDRGNNNRDIFTQFFFESLGDKKKEKKYQHKR